VKLAAHLKNSRIITGTHALNEAFKVNSSSLIEFWLVDDWESRGALRSWVHSLGPKFVKQGLKKNKAILDGLAPFHQGAIGFFKSLQPPTLESLVKGLDIGVLLVLDGIEDPHNLGAILRTAWLTGVKAVVTTAHQSVRLTPIVHKVACGGVEHVPIYSVSSLGPTLEFFKKNDVWVYGLSHRGDEDLFSLSLAPKICWCIGAEGKGLRSTTLKSCDLKVSIPQADSAASYNASVATGMVLIESLRQHSK
jgi:23S rRNA (guanosine2251-2'-O)-methyltransferase